MKSILLLISLLVFSPGEAAAQNNNTLHGKVRSTGGVTVNNAIVELWQYGALISQTATRTEGDFYFTNLAPGEYEVVVNASGFETGTQSARFMPSNRSPIGDLLNIEVLLRPKADPKQPPARVSFAQDVPKAARTAFDEGVEKLRDGKPASVEEGIAALRQAVEIFPEYFDANFALARELLRTGKDTEALEAIERARQVNDREPAVYQLFGMIMFRQGKFAAAAYGFNGAIKLNPNHAAAHLFRARAMIELALRGDEKQRAHNFDEAEKSLDRAWELSNKQFTEIYLHRARIHESRGNKEAAAKVLEEYLKAEPKAPNAAQIQQAIENFRKK